MRLFENLIVRKCISLLIKNTSDKSGTSNSKVDDQQLGQYHILNAEGLIQPKLNTNMINEKKYLNLPINIFIWKVQNTAS